MSWKDIGPSAGYCKTDKNKRLLGDVVDYLDLTKWVEEAGISESLATGLMRTIQRLSSRRSISIPLPTQYRTMKISIFGKSAHRIIPIQKVSVKYPEEMFPVSWNAMKPLTYIYVDIVYIVASMLMDETIVGK